MPVCHGHDAGYARAETLCVEAGSVKLGDGNKSAVDSLVELSGLLQIGVDELLCINDNDSGDIDPDNIFADRSREYVLKLMTTGQFPIAVDRVFYQLSPDERMRVLQSMKNRHCKIDHDLFVKLTVAEQQLVRRGGFDYED